MDNNALAHHGIKGQHWGVRRGPPYPIEDTVLRKGTRINSVSFIPDSDVYKKRKAWMYTFNPEDEWDSKVYKGPFSLYKMKTAGYMIHEHYYETVKDLKMPTKKERIDEFVKLYSDNSRMVSKDLQKVQKLLKMYNVPGFDKKENFKNLNTESDYEYAYAVFNHAMETMNSYRSTKAYARIMSQKYDAMVDDNNQSVYNRAHDPVIIFRAEEALKTIGPCKMVTVKEVTANFDDVEKELAKKGEKVKL